MREAIDWSDDKPKEECGLFGIYGSDIDVARLTYYGLYALQHRGQESAGIAVSDGKSVKLHKNLGLVPEVFSADDLAKLKGKLAIGHVRYSTTGSNLAINAQPLVCYYAKGQMALAHNGNLVNTAELRKSLFASGSVFQTSIDSEVIVNIIARHCHDSIEDAVQKAMIDIKGAYCLLVMTENKLIGIRDPFAVHPLCIGKLGDAYIITSESCALDTVGAEFIRDVEPGEIVVVDEDGLHSIKALAAKNKAACVFEYIYFARPDSHFDGFNVSAMRQEMGRQLAREYTADVDMVIPIPDSGTLAARGYAEESGIPYKEGLMKNRYIGRTFIQPDQSMRELAVRLKLNPMKDVLKGKKVICIDDSIVRGTTSIKIVKMLRDAGVKEVHMCISSPPILHPCYYGIDTSEREELVAAKMSLEEIRQYIGADGLHYLSLDGLLNIFGKNKKDFCSACFDGKYPIKIPKDVGKFILE